jgi:thymidylate synthase
VHVIHARNVNDALPKGLALLRDNGVRENSRNGPVLRVTAPVTTVYANPTERVLFAHWRDANPFFHLVESLWMLAGRNDLAQLTPYVARMAEFSDDGGLTQPAAYGRRWRDWFGYSPLQPEQDRPVLDQLDWVVNRLRANPNDRRVVIQMWDAQYDPWAANRDGKDVPCNLTALPYVTDGALHLTVFCRSNDVIWGAYGANAVQFSVLLEYLAGRIGLLVGTYTQVSNNFHGYEKTLPDLDAYFKTKEDVDPYCLTRYRGTDATIAARYPAWVESLNLFAGDWLDNDSRGSRERLMREDLDIFFEHGAAEAATKARWPWLRRVAVPMALAHRHWKNGRGEDRYVGALEILGRVQARDWRLAGEQWIGRRYDAWKEKT